MREKNDCIKAEYLATSNQRIAFHSIAALSPAAQYFNKLHAKAPSAYLEKFLRSLKLPKEHTMKILIAGINKFNKIANLSYKEREKIYGSPFSGLYYCNDLTNIWNEKFDTKIKPNDVILTAPARWWSYRMSEGRTYLVYNGINPSKALDKLLQGPTVIDCAMFCQISIWFGIRYMIGNRLFNRLFGNRPFYITQILYNEIHSAHKPYLGNPLMPFFDIDIIGVSNRAPTICIKSILNHNDYKIKHPAGLGQSENCIVIGDAYTIFSPLTQSFNLTKKEVQNYLFESFNKPPDHHDDAKIKAYSKHRLNSIHKLYQITYGELIHLSQLYAKKTLTKKEWLASSKELGKYIPTLQFDYDKFFTWVSLQEKIRYNSSMLFPLLAQVKLSNNIRKILHNHIMRRLHLDRIYHEF
ncbi:MAG: hypothetical protein ACK4PR_01210 [Gammaproteobacteria bacterium]